MTTEREGDEAARRREEEERREKAEPEKKERMPPAGPHDRPDLINPDATPGSGILPSPDERDGETDPAGG
ncbi:hypothetical protein [Salinarimonas sp.]|uniref:hypothetical protein n=1 Tax=Salinarimonas sp. TaxID=2766526 RepID=UPI0032D8D812